MARDNVSRYQAMAERGRLRAREYASAESIWPTLAAALDAATQPGQWKMQSTERPLAA